MLHKLCYFLTNNFIFRVINVLFYNNNIMFTLLHIWYDGCWSSTYMSRIYLILIIKEKSMYFRSVGSHSYSRVIQTAVIPQKPASANEEGRETWSFSCFSWERMRLFSTVMHPQYTCKDVPQDLFYGKKFPRHYHEK